jgi:hypothetical protein
LPYVKASSYYQGRNGKEEHFHGTFEKVCFRKKALLDQDHAKIIIGSYIAFNNNQWLHSTYAFIDIYDQPARKFKKNT